MNWLETYGKPSSHYKGFGMVPVVHDGEQKQINVQIEVAQLFDGRIYCELESDNHILTEIEEINLLLGTTEYGYTINIQQMWVISSHSSYGLDLYSLRTIVMGQVTVTSPNRETSYSPSSQIRFLITNFSFFSGTAQKGPFTWETRNCSITLQPLPNHKTSTETIRAKNIAGITSIVVVEPIGEAMTLEEVERQANKLCWLLSLAQGCHISWIYHESFSNKHLSARHHRNIPSLPPTGRQIIPRNPEDFYGYILHCLQVYDEKEQNWQISKLIDMFVRATMTQPFPEPIGLQLGVLLDYMRGIYAKSAGRERLVEQDVFDRIKPELRRGILKLIKDILPETNSRTRDGMVRHINMFQWKTFGDSIKGMAKSLNLKTSDDEIEDFVKERDSLVHKYGFSTEGDELKSCENMISLVTKFMFAIFGYQGYFYDWSIPIQEDWENRKIKLNLSETNEVAGDGTDG